MRRLAALILTIASVWLVVTMPNPAVKSNFGKP